MALQVQSARRAHQAQRQDIGGDGRAKAERRAGGCSGRTCGASGRRAPWSEADKSPP